MVIAEVSVVPLGTGTTSLSGYVAQAIETLQKQKNIKYELTAMGTIIEGEYDAIMAAVKMMHQSVLDAGVLRVVTTIKIDDRRDKDATSVKKLESVKKKLGREGS